MFDGAGSTPTNQPPTGNFSTHKRAPVVVVVFFSYITFHLSSNSPRSIMLVNTLRLALFSTTASFAAAQQRTFVIAS